MKYVPHTNQIIRRDATIGRIEDYTSLFYECGLTVITTWISNYSQWSDLFLIKEAPESRKTQMGFWSMQLSSQMKCFVRTCSLIPFSFTLIYACSKRLVLFLHNNIFMVWYIQGGIA